jgi:DNA-binding MarR family transcriptional regulator
MDAASKRGPWTRDVLEQIARQPGVVSTVLAGEMDWDRADFKAHVRRLKELGLTISLEVGYRISPRGAAYLARQPPGTDRYRWPALARRRMTSMTTRTGIRVAGW